MRGRVRTQTRKMEIQNGDQGSLQEERAEKARGLQDQERARGWIED